MRELYKIQTEQCVLVGLITFVEAYDSVHGQLIEELFYADRHKIILRAIHALKKKDAHPDFVMLSDWLKDQKLIDAAGGDDYIMKMIADTPSSFVMLKGHIERLYDLMALRNARTAIKNGDDQIENNPEAKAHDIINKVASDLISASVAHNAKESTSINDCLRELITDLESKEVKGHTTGFDDLDQMVGFIEEGDLVVIAARPSMGKTAFAVNVLNHIVETSNKACLFISLEMPKKQITRRIISAGARIPVGVLRDRNLSTQNWEDITREMARLNKIPLFINDQSGMTLGQIRTQANELVRKHGQLGAVAIDYLGLMGGLSANNRTNDIGEVTKGLKQLAKELGCPVFILSQLNRGVEMRTNKRPMMSDLRDSGAIEQDADLIIMLYRDEYYNGEKSKFKGVAEVILAKQRNGETGTIYLGFQGMYSRFVNLKDYIPPPPEKEKKGYKDE